MIHTKPSIIEHTAKARLGHIAMLGNYPPRRCGIATFTQDNYLALRTALPESRIDLFAMDDGAVDDYPPEVAALVPDQDLAAYRKLADRINASGAQMLWIQHEFGIFGGAAGGHLLALLDRLTVPYALMLHTILAAPNADQRQVFEAMIAGASAIVVMAEKGREILAETYGVGGARVTVIPHGVPDRPLVDTAPAKAELGFADRKLILTFGLLSPDKGIAEMIEAMPAILQACPEAHYLILGQTHPNVIKSEGEAYRESLQGQAEALGVQHAVSFVNRYMTLDDLTHHLSAADVYVTPYRSPFQITSGTLSYAIGQGRPVVSTPYVHATEILADDHGKLVPFRDSAGMAREIAGLLSDDAQRDALSRRAYARGRTMIWSRLAESLLVRLGEIEKPVAAKLPAAVVERAAPVAFVPVERMTDGVGILQHSVFNVPNRDHGYCIDDNARALMLMSEAADLPRGRRDALSQTYAAFVQHAWNEAEGCYRNFMGYDRQWLEACGSDDSNGRTLWALGVTAARNPDVLMRRWATQMFDGTVSRMREMNSPRAQAFAMLGAVAMLEAHPGHGQSLVLAQNLGGRLCSLVGSVRRADWVWFESALAYDNTRLPEALIRAGQALGQPGFTRAGLESLEWSVKMQTAELGHFRPIGTLSFGEPYGAPHAFDQQPLEAWAMIDACGAAFAATGDRVWHERARAAYRWFLGENDLGMPIVSPESGECFDGLTPVGINLNSGAESVLAWQFGVRAYQRLTKKAGLERLAEAG